jgi:ankyrin repeat protein
LKDLAEKHPGILQRENMNSWQPLHGSVRAGNVGVVQYLLENSANIDHQRSQGGGSTPLGLAIEHLPEDHPIIELLERYGAEF